MDTVAKAATAAGVAITAAALGFGALHFASIGLGIVLIGLGDWMQQRRHTEPFAGLGMIGTRWVIYRNVTLPGVIVVIAGLGLFLAGTVALLRALFFSSP